MKRREFLRVPIVSAAAGALLDACVPGSDQVIPILIPEEEFIPGVESWHQTTCPLCPSHCGLEARKVDGRVVKIEGHRAHPTSQGGVCAAGQALPQLLYHPDRLTRPLLRNGESLDPIDWDDARGHLLGAFAATETGRRPTVGIIADDAEGASRFLLEEFAAAWDSTRLWSARPFARHAEARAVELVTGRPGLLSLPLERMSYVLSLGEELLSGSSAVWGARCLTAARHGTPGARAKWVSASPRLSASGASADEWVPLSPGNESWLCLAIARRLLATDRVSLESVEVDGFEAFAAWLRGVTPETLATRCGVDQRTIDRLAAEMWDHRPAAAIVGPRAFALAGDLEAHLAGIVLNSLLGNFGGDGLMRLDAGRIVPVNEDRTQPARKTWETWSEELPSVSDEPPPDALIIVDSDPLYTLEEESFRRWADRIPFIVKIGPFEDDTAALCDLVLPETTPLERWDSWWSQPLERSPVSGASLGISQPLLARALHDSRSLGEVLRMIGRPVEPPADGRQPAAGMLDADDDASQLRAYLSAVTSDTDGEGQGVAGTLEEGGIAATGPPPSAIERLSFSFDGLESTVDAASTEASPSELTLLVYASPTLDDGRRASLPFLQELADPVTGCRWDSVLELNPQTAQRLGITDGDSVRVSTRQSEATLTAALVPGIRPDVIALATGQGHGNYTRYASQRGVNAFHLLDRTSMTKATVERVDED